MTSFVIVEHLLCADNRPVYRMRSSENIFGIEELKRKCLCVLNDQKMISDMTAHRNQKTEKNQKKGKMPNKQNISSL